MTAQPSGAALSVKVVESIIDSESGKQPILKIHSTKEGLLWFAKQEGVNLYDGDSLRRYVRGATGPGSIPSTNVTRIIEGPKGQIIVATDDAGLLLYDSDLDLFLPYRWTDTKDITASDLSSALYDTSGRIWVGHKSGGISLIDPKQHRSSFYLLEDSERIADITESEAGGLFAASATGAIYQYDAHTDSFQLLKFSHECNVSLRQLEEISTIDELVIWAGTRQSGVFKFHIKEQMCEPVTLPNRVLTRSRNVYIHDIYQDPVTNSTWISSDQGLYVFDANDNLEHIHTGNSKLASNEIGQVVKGKEGLYWLSTYSGIYLALHSPFELFGPKSDPRLRAIVDIDNSFKNGLWIATYEGLLHTDMESSDFEKVNSFITDSEFTNERIMTIASGPDDLWIGYRASGLEHYSIKSAKLEKYTSSAKNSVSSDSISDILIIDTNYVLVGTYGGGLNLVEADGKVTQIANDVDRNRPGDRFIVMLFQTTDGRVWVGTEGGLYNYNVSSRSLEHVAFGDSITSDEIQPVVWTMAESANGDLWFGTQHDGLLTSSLKSGSTPEAEPIESYDFHPTLDNLIVYSIEVDNQQTLWLSTNQGITRIQPNSKMAMHYSKSRGLQETDFEKGASYKDPQGRLYFGGSNGYNRFDPADVKQDTRPSEVILTDINIAGERPASPALIRELDGIELTYEDYFVNFTFSVLDFLDPASNQYRYKLVNFDPEWIESGTRNTATYTSLPSGRYTLRVQGANSEGVWNRDGITLQVRVLPSNWQTWWAYCAYMAVGLFLVAAARQYYRNSAHKQEAIKAEQAANDATDKAVDDLHDQLDYQDELVKAVYQHNVATLDLLKDCIKREGQPGPEFTTRRATVNDMNRVAALTSLEDCLFYQNDTLLANLHKYTESLLFKLMEESPLPVENIVTINEVSPRRLPVGVASPLAIILFELLENVLTHAFTRDSPVNYVHVEMGWPEQDGAPGAEMVLSVQDNGVGLPVDITPATVHSSGLAIVVELARRLAGKLEFSNVDGTRISLTLPDPLEIV